MPAIKTQNAGQKGGLAVIGNQYSVIGDQEQQTDYELPVTDYGKGVNHVWSVCFDDANRSVGETI
jgi:hypothetical protein